MNDFSIWSQENDPILLSLGKGMALGGTGLAAIYGINELRRFIADKLYDKPEVLPEALYFRDPKAKYSPDEMDPAGSRPKRATKLASYFSQAHRAALAISQNKEIIKLATEDMSDTVLRKFLYGFGIPMGVLGSYKTINYFRDKEEEARLRSKLKELDLAMRGKGGPEMARLAKAGSLDVHAALYQGATPKEIELIKMALDPEINKFIDSQIKIAGGDGKGVIEITTETAKGLADFLAAIPKYAPYAFGLGAGLGGLAGYYGTKYYLDPASALPSDILKRPELIYAIQEKKKQKKGIGNKEAALVDSMAKQISAALSKQGNFIGDYVETLTTPVGERIKSDVRAGVLEGVEEAKGDLLQPSTLGYLALGGTALAAPGVLAYYLIKQQEDEKKKKVDEAGENNLYGKKEAGWGWDLARDYGDITKVIPESISSVLGYYAQEPAKELGKGVEKGVREGAGKAFGDISKKVLSPKGLGGMFLAGGAFALPNILSSLFGGGGGRGGGGQQQAPQQMQQFKPPSMAESYKGFSASTPRKNPGLVPGAASSLQSSLM